MDGDACSITIARKSPKDVRVRQIYIPVDGTSVAELLYGQSFATAIAPGPYSLRAHSTLVWKTLHCDLNPGTHARFTVVNRPGLGTYAMLGLLGSGPLYLTFERED